MKKHQEKTTGKLTSLLIITVVAAAFIGFTYFNFTKQTDTEIAEQPASAYLSQGRQEAGISAELVCMVNDAYMGGKKQIPVPFEGKTYYGCCQMCVGRIKNDPQVRYAKDPVTGEKVDKSEAYIVRKGNHSDEVLYFQSKENFSLYKQTSP